MPNVWCMFPVYISLTRAHSLSFYAMCSLFHHKAPNESKPMHRPVMKFEAACKMHFKVRTHSWKICVNNPPCSLWFLINSFWHLRRQTVEHYAHFLFFSSHFFPSFTAYSWTSHGQKSRQLFSNDIWTFIVICLSVIEHIYGNWPL